MNFHAWGREHFVMRLYSSKKQSRNRILTVNLGWVIRCDILHWIGHMITVFLVVSEIASPTYPNELPIKFRSKSPNDIPSSSSAQAYVQRNPGKSIWTLSGDVILTHSSTGHGASWLTMHRETRILCQSFDYGTSAGDSVRWIDDQVLTI